ncbi:MAG: adenosylcobinamide-GDP ribazoletransferase, partial [Halomonadaceae bacterium]|nr:adenosylcobinamide-GDP ribazoletransferase [Halomonadaceae bacterium]
MKDAIFGVLLAIQFLTRLPVPVACPWNAGTRRWAARAYPLVGALIGALVGGIGVL